MRAVVCPRSCPLSVRPSVRLPEPFPLTQIMRAVVSFVAVSANKLTHTQQQSTFHTTAKHIPHTTTYSPHNVVFGNGGFGNGGIGTYSEKSRTGGGIGGEESEDDEEER